MEIPRDIVGDMWSAIRSLIRKHSAAAFLAAALLFASGYAFSLKPWTPIFDELEYLAYGRSLAVAGVYASTPAGAHADATPGREPAYPAIIAAAIHLNPGLHEAVVTCWPHVPSCGQHVADLRYVNAAFIAVAAWLAFLTVRTLGHGGIAALVAGAYILLNLQMNKTASHVISDYLALALVALLGFALAKAMAGRALGWWFTVGASLAALVLTKSIYLLFAALLLVGIGLWNLTCWRQLGTRAFLPLLIVALLVTGPVGAWYARNLSLFNRISDSRGAIALSTREIFNHMTPAENAASFLWWTRGFGEKMARHLLPESAWRRHELYAEDGFYIQGQIHRFEERVQRQMAEKNVGRAEAEAAMPGLIVSEVLARWPSYLATMPALFYRGLWFDEFIVFGLPALIGVLLSAVRRQDARTLAALAAGVFSLVAYAALSLNIPRYQFTAAPALAVGAGIAAEVLARRWRERQKR